MTLLAEICKALYQTYLERLEDMTFVLDKNWPIWKID